MKILFIRLLSVALVSSAIIACGSAKPIEEESVSGANGTIGRAVFQDPSPIQFGSCLATTLLSVNDNTSQYLQGSQICTSSNFPNIIKVQVPANVPVNTRLCAVAFTETQTSQTNCFTINGQTNVTLSVSNPAEVYLFHESALSTAQAWLNYQNVQPSMAKAVFRQLAVY